jgi:hypothetical protein
LVGVLGLLARGEGYGAEVSGAKVPIDEAMAGQGFVGEATRA